MKQAKHVYLALHHSGSLGKRAAVASGIAELLKESCESLVSCTSFTEVESKQKISYMVFFKWLQKFDVMRLVNQIRVQSGGGEG